jgi:hypothetical protein
MQVQGGFILGFDSDHRGVFEKLITFIQESGVVMAMIGLLNAPRGTKLYERLLREQRLTKVPSGDNADCSINFVPKMGLADLLHGYRQVIETTYSHQIYCKRVKAFLRSYRASPITKARLGFPGLRTLLKSMWHVGILDAGRRHYWSLLFWALRKRHYFHMAVMFSIYGYHFRKTFVTIIQREETQSLYS